VGEGKRVLRQTRPHTSLLRCNSTPFVLQAILRLCVSDRPDWLEANNRNFRALWAQYNTSPRVVGRPKVLSNDLDNAIDSFMSPGALADNSTDDDEFDMWKRKTTLLNTG
jgi:hypothetical protein